MKKPFLLLAFGLVLTGTAVAQTYQAPTGYTLKAPADYARYDTQVIESVNWLEATSPTKETEQRQSTNQFLMQWMTGTPAVSVQLQEYTAEITAKDPNLLMLFLGGWSRYQLQHPEAKDAVLLNTEAVKTVLKGYQTGGYKRNKKIESLITLNDKGTLADWVKAQMKSKG
jgi:hypothetical protein